MAAGFPNPRSTTARAGIAALAAALALAAAGRPAHAAFPTTNGLFFGDGDVDNYYLLGLDTTGGSKGKVYHRVEGSRLHIALVVNKEGANDAVFGTKSQDGAYMQSADWNAVHTFSALYGSDHAVFGIECGATADTPDWAFNVDLLYDADGDQDPNEADFLGDPFGSDGLATRIPPGFESATSIAWNMNNTLWDVTLGGSRATPGTWKSPDQGTIGTVTDDSYTIGDDSTVAGNYNSALQWEWALVYEFSFDHSSCTGNLFVSPGTSHNSPSKDGTEDTTYPALPPIDPTYASISGFESFVRPDGAVVVEWRTGLEEGTLGFHLERFDEAEGRWVRVNRRLLPGLMTAPQGGAYRLVDPDAAPGRAERYRLEEVELSGARRAHGPFAVTPERRSGARSLPAAGRTGAQPGFEAVPHALAARAPGRPSRIAAAAGGGPGGGAEPFTARVEVREDGVVAVSVEGLAAAFGMPVKPVEQWIAAGQLRVTSRGGEVAWTPAAGGGGILFYGRKLDSLYTRDNVYWITKDGGTVMARARGARPAPAPGGSFVDTLTFEEDRFPATFVARDAEADYWFWDFVWGGVPGFEARSFAVTAPDAVEGLEVAVRLSGATASAHPVEVRLNGQLLASGSGSGTAGFTLRGAVPPGALASGANTVTVTGLPGDGQNIAYVDQVRVTYRRAYRAAGDALLATASGPVTTIDGFASAGVVVWDVADAARPVVLEALTLDAGPGGSRVSFASTPGRRYLAVGSGALRAAVPQAVAASALAAGPPAEYVVITAGELADPSDAAQALADHRRAAGLSARVVTVDEIYRQMSHGIATPHALRDFLAWSRGRWGVRYATLLGTASVDYRGLIVPGESVVPTLMTPTPYGLSACDACLADFDGDGVPELAVGRVPAAGAAEAAAFVAKLAAHESGNLPLTDGAVLLLADRFDRLAGDFAADSEELAALLPPSASGSVERIYLDELDGGTARRRTLDWIGTGGAGWVNYLGHGGMTLLGKGEALLASGDAALLANGAALPVLTAMTCAANRFEIAGVTALGEELVLDPDGGAIAVWAPTGLALHGASWKLSEELFQIVYQERAAVLGDALLEALRRNRPDNVPHLLRIYSLLGDPATRLR